MVDVVGEDGTFEQTCSLYDSASRRLWPGVRVQSALARGYWEPFDGDIEIPARPPRLMLVARTPKPITEMTSDERRSFAEELGDSIADSAHHDTAPNRDRYLRWVAEGKPARAVDEDPRETAPSDTEDGRDQQDADASREGA